MRLAEYPLYILEQDDHSIFRIDSESGLTAFEQIDVEDGLYVIWDSAGFPGTLSWNHEERRPFVILSDTEDISSFKAIAENYSDLYRKHRERGGKLTRLCDPQQLLDRVRQMTSRTRQR